MALPATRQEFADHCLRRLGHPVIGIEVTEEQIDDRIDEALEYYHDYHYSGTEKHYFKYQMSANNHSTVIYDCTVANGGIGYANSDVVVFSGGGGNSAAASITTDANGTILDCTLSDNGTGYANPPDVTVTTGGGTGASITAELGGFIPLPENIIGAVKIFPAGASLSSNDMFNLRYQIALNDLYTLTHTSMVPYYSAFQHVQLLEEILVGQQPIRFNRHTDRVYVDMDWSIINNGDFIIVEAYRIIDPETWPDVWADRWLIAYVTALIKKQWGQHLSKFSGMMLPGGLQFNGQEIQQEAQQEIEKLEYEMVHTYSMPVNDFIGAYAPFFINTTIGGYTLIELYNVWNNIPMV
jgi:hypothetical protein